MKPSLLPLAIYIIFIVNPKPSKKVKVVFTILFIILSWISVYTQYTDTTLGYFQLSISDLFFLSGVLLILAYRGNGKTAEPIIFSCPFCHNTVSFDKLDINKSKNCPLCQEVVTVTEDEEVHRAAKESYDAILEAMDKEELQEDEENLTAPSLSPSVLGFQFDLQTKNKNINENSGNS